MNTLITKCLEHVLGWHPALYVSSSCEKKIRWIDKFLVIDLTWESYQLMDWHLKLLLVDSSSWKQHFFPLILYIKEQGALNFRDFKKRLIPKPILRDKIQMQPDPFMIGCIKLEILDKYEAAHAYNTLLCIFCCQQPPSPLPWNVKCNQSLITL